MNMLLRISAFFALILLPALVIGEGVSIKPDRAGTPRELEAIVKKQQAFLSLDPYVHEAIALDTNALYADRIDSLQMLTNNPTAHMGALKTLAVNPDYTLRLTAIEIIDLVDPGFAWTSAKQLLVEVNQLSTNRIFPRDVLRPVRFLARKGDGSGFPLLVDYLLKSSNYSDVSSAISGLSDFMYLKELEPHKPLVAFIDQTLPKLISEGDEVRDDFMTLIEMAPYKLSGLHAVETIPDFHRWLVDPRTEPFRDALEFNLRILNNIQAKLDAGEPDKRDDPAYHKVPSVDSAWNPKKSIRY